jgi:hypothetical protein
VSATDDGWPDRAARLAHEIAILTHHATDLSAQYPESMWPRSGATNGSEREGAVAQRAFVAGIRFACDQMHGRAAELREQLDASDPVAKPEAPAEGAAP